MPYSFLSDKIAVVTGAGGALCSEIARELARHGAKVALLGRTLSALDTVAAEIRRAGGVALSVACDVTDAAAVERARETVTRELGACHFLLNGAGGYKVDEITTLTEFSPAELAVERPAGTIGFFNLDPAKYAAVLKVNALGTVIPCQIFGREMAQLERGAILNFASMHSYRPLTRAPTYAMAKAGVINFTAWLAVYLAPARIRVNAIAPGFYINEQSRKILMTEDGGLTARGQKVIAHTPLRRFGQPTELLGCVSWLLNDEVSGFVTGITIPVDGGFLASAGV